VNRHYRSWKTPPRRTDAKNKELRMRDRLNKHAWPKKHSVAQRAWGFEVNYKEKGPNKLRVVNKIRGFIG
jgi:hypothetical protein